MGYMGARSTKQKNAPKKSQADALPTAKKLPAAASPPDSAVSTAVASATGGYSAEQRELKAVLGTDWSIKTGYPKRSCLRKRAVESDAVFVHRKNK